MIRSYRIEFYFSVSVARTPGAPPTLLRGKLAGLPTEPAALNALATAYGNGVYGTAGMDTVFTETVMKHGNGNGYGNVMLKTRCQTLPLLTLKCLDYSNLTFCISFWGLSPPDSYRDPTAGLTSSRSFDLVGRSVDPL